MWFLEDLNESSQPKEKKRKLISSPCLYFRDISFYVV